MASENSTENTAFEDLMLALFAILLVGQIAQKGPEILSEKFGVSLGENQYLVAGVALTADTPIGSKVNVPNGAPYYTEPGDTEKSGDFLPGTALVITDGPETIDGERWWQVKNPATGTTAWVKESMLIREGVNGIGPSTQVGAKARALLDVDLWNAPAGTIKTGSITTGEWGELTKGPRNARGSQWWFFDTEDSDEDGWVTQTALMLASETGWEKGSVVKGKRTIDIYERVGGGQIVGLLKKDERATILSGPVEVSEMLWWFIETEDDEEGWVPERDLKQGGVKGVFKVVVTTIMIVGIMITLLLLGGIVYVTIRTNQVRAKEKERLKSAIPKSMQPLRNERWEKIEAHIKSENPNDWRLGIIEADILLDELLTNMGYQGGTLGEKLKQVVKGDIETLEEAWEAHKIRNMIAHAGSDYILTRREAERVIQLYETVFTECKAI